MGGYYRVEKNTMTRRKNRVYPVERAGSLDARIRRWVQDPRKIMQPFVEEGMTVLDIGCGPGYFTIDMARMVGGTGRVIAVDLQEGMLHKLRAKIEGSELEARIRLHKSEANRIGVTEKADFALCFYLLHELPDQRAFFAELLSILKPDGQALLVEPPIHVSRKAFAETVEKAREAGFTPAAGPRVFLSKSAVLRKG
jgi:ubiquinone/menaquinone biosynthesis C-methylase UbiE